MIDKADKLTLMERAAFRRFLFDLIQAGGLFTTTATEADGRALYLEGRRSIVLDVLRDMDEAAPAQSSTGIPVLTLIQTLREEVQSAPSTEKKLGRRSGPYSDLGDDSD